MGGHIRTSGSKHGQNGTLYEEISPAADIAKNKMWRVETSLKVLPKIANFVTPGSHHLFAEDLESFLDFVLHRMYV